ncbi:MAG: M6 family metalloprotease domain-containing protein [Muribaculaceae bacterium]|nr:M6 family metalloprotease domain-containing protein [Muribaculaceae bacterium]
MKRKIFCATALLFATALSSLAIPAKPGERVFRQSDGSEITLRLIGDEHFHTYLTSDGLTVGRGKDGNFYYQKTADLTDIMAHDPADRGAVERSFIKEVSSELLLSSLAEAREEIVKQRRVVKMTTRAGKTQVPNVGSPHVPVLLVQYQDKKFKDADPKETFETFFNKGDVNAYKYFEDQSNGKYTPKFDIYGPFTLPEKRSYYGENDSYGNDKRLGEMVALSAIGLDDKIDYSIYDNDGDGECDVLIILYAGDGEASSEDRDAENSIWPCQWVLSASDYRKALTLDDTKVDKFACFNELNGSNRRRIDGIGTFCHEFSHCLGLPDFYDTKYSGFFGMGPWSIMDSGSYNNDTYTPCGYSAYEKEFMGWIDIEEGAANTQYTLPVFNSGSEDTDRAVKLTSSKDNREYYILENRKKQGWDKYMYGEGLFIYHVTYNQNSWAGNTVNNYSLQRMCPVPCDNSLKMSKYTYWGETYYEIDNSDLPGDLWPFNGNNELTDTSTPAAKLNSGGGFLGKPVTEIEINPDGTASFWVMKGVNGPSGIDEIEAADEEAEYYTLQGLRVDAPDTPGIYIVKKGTKVSKIRI